MKQTLLVAVASATIGASVAVLLTSDATPPVRASPITVASLRTAFQEALDTSLTRLEAQMRVALRDPSRFGESERPRGQDADIVNERGRPADADGAVCVPSEVLSPPPDRARVEQLLSWKSDEAIRRGWMFRSERDVLRWFGTPDSVSVYTGGVEGWYYRLASEPSKRTRVDIHRGRVVGVMLP